MKKLNKLNTVGADNYSPLHDVRQESLMKINTLFAIDVGNTNIKAALFKKGKLVKSFYITKYEKKYVQDADHIIIVSVCPKKLKALLPKIKKSYKGKIYIIGKDIKVPIKSRYNQKQIGQDRLVTAYAAMKLYKTPVLIIDFGTGVTFDLVDNKKVYSGGLIFPGVHMSLESLSEKTELLPRISLGIAKGLLGLNTQDSIRNGIVYGYTFLVDNLVKKFKELYPKLKIVSTGGDALFLSKYTKNLGKINKDIVFYGIKFLSNRLKISDGNA